MINIFKIRLEINLQESIFFLRLISLTELVWFYLYLFIYILLPPQMMLLGKSVTGGKLNDALLEWKAGAMPALFRGSVHSIGQGAEECLLDSSSGGGPELAAT